MTNTTRRRGAQAPLARRRDPALTRLESSRTSPGSSVGLMVEYAETADMDDGQPLPPLILNGVVWRVLRRLADGRTRWCRISLTENPHDPAAARSRGTSSHGGK